MLCYAIGAGMIAGFITAIGAYLGIRYRADKDEQRDRQQRDWIDKGL